MSARPVVSAAQIAELLAEVYQTKRPCEPLSEQFDGLDVMVAYKAQAEQVARWRNNGRRVVGYKIGLTSKPMQEQLGIDEPDYGHLMDDMVYRNGAQLPSDRFLQPKIEPEVAFVLGRRIRGPGLTTEAVAAAVGSVAPALEIIDSRISDWRITLPDTVADNGSSAALVLGSSTEASLQSLPSMGCELFLNDDSQAKGLGAAVLGDPLVAATWLANVLGEQGVVLEPEDIILTGSWTAAIDVGSGDSVRADFGLLGEVICSFA